MAENNSKKRIAGQEDNYQRERPPSAAYIAWFMAEADTTSPSSVFHRLGFLENEAAPGNHLHDGRNSAFLFDPATDIINGDLATSNGLQTAVREIARLLALLGATNSTTN